MITTPTTTYLVGVIERALAYYKVEAENPRAAAENWEDGAFDGRDDEALESEGPCNVRECQPDGNWRIVPPSEWETEPPSGATGNKPYSVLLLYPDYANDSGTETYYAFVESTDAIAADTVARRQAIAAQEGVAIDPNDFVPLLVTGGHHYSEPLFNK